MSNYTILHCHTMLSNGITNIDSVTPYRDYIDAAAKAGMKALAFSEHGCVLGWVNKKKAVEKAGMKYIHAQEFYVTESLAEKIRDNYHCLLIAKNYDGVKELNVLSSRAFNREDGHFYYSPRITFDELLSTSENIIVSSACIAGIFGKGGVELRKRFLQFYVENKDRCYLEIQHHISEDQKTYNKVMYEMSKRYNLKLLMCTDTHALNDKHVDGRRILQKSKNIYFSGEDEFDLTFKTYDELLYACNLQNAMPIEAYKEAIENTNKIADSIEEFKLDFSYKYPHLWGDDSENIFKQKIIEGIKKKGINDYPNYQEYLTRIKQEMLAYKHNGAIDFMLLMEDIACWCKSQGMHIGYGRGSVNGSVIAWILGITEMDSIKHNLNFERFMNIERQSLADIDTDFNPDDIEKVKDYIYSKHGLYCSDIVTFNTIAMKGAIRDVGRAMEYPLQEVSDICNEVERNEEKCRKKYPELFDYVDIVFGTIVSVGTHPCGLVVSPITLEDNMGLMTLSTTKYPVSQTNMKEIDSQNYVKLDLLKLDTIRLIADTCKLANIDFITPDTIDIYDDDVWKSMREDTTQIFQWEGGTGQHYIKKLLSDENLEKLAKADNNIDYMTLLSIGNSAIRPAGASYRDDLANGVIRTTGYECLDDFLKPTFGYLVFQCQIIEFLHQYCGFTMGEADLVRRKFAKKTGTEDAIPVIKYGGYINPDKKDHYIKGFMKTMEERYGLTQEEGENAITEFIQVIIDASDYLFSVNHSTPYSYEGYVSAWLRYYYPLEFLTAALNINEGKQEKTNAIIAYAKNNNIKIEGIRFRYSGASYTFNKEKRAIYKGMSSIKHLNKRAANNLYKLRKTTADNFIDLLVELGQTSVDSRQLDILIKLDYFREFGHPKQLLEQVEIFKRLYGKKNMKIEQIERMGMPREFIENFGGVYTEKLVKNIDMLKLIKYLCDHREYPKTTVIDRIGYEQEHLGYIDLKMPEVPDSFAYVTEVKKSFNNYMIKLYRLSDGNVETVKVRGKTYGIKPIHEKMIIETVEAADEKKWGKTPDGQWYKKDETETILKQWRIVR